MRIRAFVPDDTEAVLALRGRSFRGLDLERERVRWSWEYEANPGLPEGWIRSWVAEQGGELIGNYGLLPVPVAIDGQRALAACAIDVCVDPAHRNLGLGLQLTRQFLRTPGVALWFSTSATAETAQLLAYCGTRVLKLESEPSLWIHPPAGALLSARPGLELLAVPSFDERCDELFARVAREHRLLTLRDRAYMNWRYRDYPFGEPGELQAFALAADDGGYRGLCVLQLDPGQGRAYLLEVLAPAADEEAVLALVAEAARRKARAGASELYALHRSPGVRRQLERAGFARVSSHDVRILLHGGRHLPGLEDWYVSSGDGDLLFGVGR